MSKKFTIPLNRDGKVNWSDPGLAKEIARLMRENYIGTKDLTKRLSACYRYPFTKNMINGAFFRKNFLTVFRKVAPDAESLLGMREALDTQNVSRANRLKAKQNYARTGRASSKPAPSKRPLVHKAKTNSTPVLVVPPVPQTTISFDELTPRRCRYAYGNGPFTYCGQPTSKPPYCEDHRRLSYQPASARRRRAHEEDKAGALERSLTRTEWR